MACLIMPILSISLGKTGAIIVMDNAAYHKGLPATTPKGTWKKQDLLDACGRLGTHATSDEYRSVIWSKVQSFVKENVDPEVVTLTRSRGYEYVYTPPYHSDLQPIEYVWAQVKGEVGRQYSTGTTMDDVRSRLDAAFNGLQSDLIYHCINHTKKRVLQMKEYVLKLEASDEAANEAPLLNENKSSDEEDSDENEVILWDIVGIEPLANNTCEL
ncbi:hypothetical protein Ae201684P_009344 [Aphanomyces euteiches]|uniref:Tc1-like transposase DDE domain-containing protein n=1 Tax=Aphanomyces euteiches TaxID=100861 RepID=A0A6G0WN10_9STRA|nr:hypothetical protein Ae201684_013480 [Aphanomyces euteiches]KAH9063079.1 hypothetical protein Ae201684P_009344 [Aphanomyces euteiches]KAH9132742.1 hypothetical protein AeRB84_020971 [Aphanomyces euteiches]